MNIQHKKRIKSVMIFLCNFMKCLKIQKKEICGYLHVIFEKITQKIFILFALFMKLHEKNVLDFFLSIVDFFMWFCEKCEKYDVLLIVLTLSFFVVPVSVTLALCSSFTMGSCLTRCSCFSPKRGWWLLLKQRAVGAFFSVGDVIDPYCQRSKGATSWAPLWLLEPSIGCTAECTHVSVAAAWDTLSKCWEYGTLRLVPSLQGALSLISIVCFLL